MKKRIATLLAASLLFSVIAACSPGETGDGTTTTTTTANGAEATVDTTDSAAETGDTPGTDPSTGGGTGIVNIGSTDPIGTMNPLLLDATEINKYSLGMSYMPLVELDNDLEFVPMLAESVTTEDNITYTVTIDERATWSDGEPITSDDLIFTMLRMGSRTIANASNSMLYMVKGFGEDGFIDDDATEAEGLVRVDDKTVDIVMQDRMPMNTFMNTYARYIFVLPQHVLGDVEATDLQTHSFFNAPTAVSGPYVLTQLDGQHYATFEANENFWLGAPKISNLNIRVVQGSSLVSALSSGEIDFVQQTFGQIPQVDQPTVDAMDHIETVYEEPLTNQLVFMNTETLPDVRVRQAIVHAIDREAIVENFLDGHGEVVDGFLTSYSPYFDDDMEITPYDPDRAQELLEEAEWDGSQTLTFKINSGDTTFTQIANVIVQQLGAVGINAQVQMQDLNSLLASAGGNDFDLLAIQYTLAPVDPYPDMDWLVGGDGNNWVSYQSDEMAGYLADSQSAEDDDGIFEAFSNVNRLVQEDAPLFNAYVIASMGAVNERLENAEPRSYGSFINVHEWEIED